MKLGILMDSLFDHFFLLKNKTLAPSFGTFCHLQEFVYYLIDCTRYERVDELIWVKTNQLQRIIRTGRTGHWLNHGKEHCLVSVSDSWLGLSGWWAVRVFNRLHEREVFGS
jgi:hypothetical protein